MNFFRHLLLAVSFLFLLTQFRLVAQIPDAGLVGWYPFNGTVNDSSGNGNNGTAASVTPVADRFGNQSGAFQFNGSTSEVLLPNNFQTQSLTVCAWYYVTQVGYDRAVFMEYKDANNRLKFGQQYNV
jgi:hypothetical protein